MFNRIHDKFISPAGLFCATAVVTPPNILTHCIQREYYYTATAADSMKQLDAAGVAVVSDSAAFLTNIRSSCTTIA